MLQKLTLKVAGPSAHNGAPLRDLCTGNFHNKRIETGLKKANGDNYI